MDISKPTLCRTRPKAGEPWKTLILHQCLVLFRNTVAQVPCTYSNILTSSCAAFYIHDSHQPQSTPVHPCAGGCTASSCLVCVAADGCNLFWYVCRDGVYINELGTLKLDVAFGTTGCTEMAWCTIRVHYQGAPSGSIIQALTAVCCMPEAHGT